MGKNKLKRFAENQSFENLIQPTREELVQGKFPWRSNWSKFFKNDKPIVLELGCGRGEYTVGMAKQFPEKNFIGIDIKGARIWRGAKTGIEDKMQNMAFIRTQIELLEQCFAENEVSEIWITFPDPQIKLRRAKHRLTHPSMLNLYKRVLKPDGLIHLKTDSEFLFGYTQGLMDQEQYKLLFATHDLYGAGLKDEILDIKTHYEEQFLKKEKLITYTKFQFHEKG